MELENVILEERLKSLLFQLQTEAKILDRIVYRSKNQHRHGLYFQYILQVRRDLKLLESAGLAVILRTLFQDISGKQPTEMILGRFKKRKTCYSKEYSFQERILGVARLLSQMVEPIIKAAMEISSLLARSFFTGFCLAILAILARIRILVQQILLDIVMVFNMVSSVSLKQQSMKLSQEGIEVFREPYPCSEEVMSLNCEWEGYKFVLHERACRGKQAAIPQEVAGETLSQSEIKYETILFQNKYSKCLHEEAPLPKLFSGSVDHCPDKILDCQRLSTECSSGAGILTDDHQTEGISGNIGAFEGENNADQHIQSTASPGPQVWSASVAYISVKKPASLDFSEYVPSNRAQGELFHVGEDNDDPLFSLFAEGTVQQTLF